VVFKNPLRGGKATKQRGSRKPMEQGNERRTRELASSNGVTRRQGETCGKEREKHKTAPTGVQRARGGNK